MSPLTKTQFQNPSSDQMTYDAMSALFQKHIGPGRFARTAYRVREQASPENSFGVNAYDEQELVGTVSFTPLNIAGNNSACLLGPLLVAPPYRSKGLGLELMQDGVEFARSKGFKVTLLVGDLEYYQKIGCTHISPGTITLPGPVDPMRFLGFEMEQGALQQLNGQIKGE